MSGLPFGRMIAEVLASSDPGRKAAAAAECAAALAASAGDSGDISAWPAAPDRPARPARPLLVPPRAVPRRRLGSADGRAALLHALAHIEFNAIDLAFDLALRFAGAIAGAGLPAADLVRDWISIGAEEAKHFNLLCNRLQAYSLAYGDLPAHDGLWASAAQTADCPAARLAICHLILEARGLDATPGLAEGLRRHGDPDSAAAVDAILHDEVGHVAAAVAWFQRIAGVRGADPAALFHTLKAERFHGRQRPPFNRAARDASGLPPGFYEPCLAPGAGAP